jgi:glycosyltransferase involved in cell wall biosynthesis
MRPEVSVIITSYNRESYISQAIKSVLESTFQNFELIILDDCSIDKSYQIACGFAELDNRVRVFKNENNIGDYPNRIRAINLSNGKWIKFVDCDDYISPDCLQEMYSFAQVSNLSFGICAPGVGSFNKLDSKSAFESGYLNYYGPTGSFFLKEKYCQLGGFVNRITVSDWHMWSRFALDGDIMVFPDYLATWRDHDNNTLKSNAHFYGMIRFYLVSKSEIIFDRRYGELGFNSSRIFRIEYMNILKQTIRFAIRIKSFKPLFNFCKYNLRMLVSPKMS